MMKHGGTTLAGQACRGLTAATRQTGTRWIVGAVALVAAALAITAGMDAAQKFLVPDGNRSTAIHRIQMLADPTLKGDDKPLGPDDKPALPYSPRATCSGRCHDYSVIEAGWHFNYPDSKAPAGRPGEPYILADLKTGTQVPISPRGWPGTFKPAAVGLTPWKFVLAFGGHTPGGAYGEKFASTPADDPTARWQVSGKLEIDCQSCHSGNPLQDGHAWASNIERENLQWAATAACGMALVRGIAKTVPETWDPMTPSTGDNPKEFPPSVAWDAWRFNSLKEIFFNSVVIPTNDRCYFCHTNHPVGKDVAEKWAQDEDVHVKAGLRCADCHRHGLDHMMTRGYEGETPPESPKATLTCRGCHLGEQSAAAGPNTVGGRMGAPVPAHKGLPTVHFKKLTCTACHSGPQPGGAAGHVQTSRAHNLGVKAKQHRDDAPPLIEWPVFMPEAGSGPEGRIAPHKVIWPAFWGRMKDTAVTPLAPEAVQAAVGDILAVGELGKWKPLTSDQILKGLTALGAQKDPAGEPVFISGGRLYRKTSDTNLESAEHAAAAPYAWPIGHEVRPKTKSLGSTGCTDCHGSESPVFFAQVSADSTAEAAPLVKNMYEFLGLDGTQLKAWSLSYQFRPMFKVVGFATAAVIGAILLAYALLAVVAFVRWVAKRAPRGPAV